MRRLAIAGPHARLRARRWDVVVLGSALPGLVAAIRLAMAHLRVLVVTDAAAARRPKLLAEPFFLAGAQSGGILDTALRELALPLIDRRRLVPDPIAYQVVWPEARVSVGRTRLTAEELEAWQLAKREDAERLVRELFEASHAELGALLEGSAVRMGGLRGLMRSRGPARLPRYARGLPAEVAEPSPTLAPLFEAQVRALVNVATPTCPPEARARLLGAALEGGSQFDTDEHGLRTLLERRFQALHGEVRAAAGKIELVQTDNHPGIALAESGEVWLGRALVVNAPLGALRAWLERHETEVPRFLPVPHAERRRVSALLRVHRDAIPEGMARRVILLRDPKAPADGCNVMTLVLTPPASGEEWTACASAAAEPGVDAGSVADELETAVRALMPFSDERLRRAEQPEAEGWDALAALEDPAPGAGWPGQSELRLASRPPVYRLAREELGVLGLEGEVLLGLQAGDAIRQEFH